MTVMGATSYEELRETFRWEVPARYNIGVDCCDRQPADRKALTYVPLQGDAVDYTFGQLRELSNRLANALSGLGVTRGDRVGIVVPQRPETGVAHLAVYKLGGIALPLSVLFGPDALRFRLADAGARAVIADSAGLEKLQDVLHDLPDLEHIVVVDEVGTTGGRVVDFWDATGAASARFDPVPTSADDPGLLIYTSGTTGAPKGALHGHRVLLGHLPGFDLSHEFFPKDGDFFWTPADWAWIGGLMDALLPAWHHGVPVLAAPRKGFDPEWASKLLADHPVRNAFLPPTALKLWRQSGVRPSGIDLRTVMSGGEVLGEEMLEWARQALGVTVNEIYGQTEVNYVVGNCAPVWEVRPGSMGRPYPGHDVQVIDEGGRPLPPGEQGEIAVRAPDPVMFLEYWGRPQATAEKYAGDWLLTGDVARRDEDGYLWFEGRADDVINSAGYRIGPGEIEDCLIRHEAIALAAVIGVPDEVRGEAVKAFVVLRDGYRPSRELEDSIQQHVRGRLAAYEYPRAIEFVAELPMTTTGKIKRVDLRALEAEGRR